MNLDLGPEENSLLELVRRMASRLGDAADSQQWWRALTESGVLDVDVTMPDGLLQAAVITEGLGEAVAPVAFPAFLTARAIIETGAGPDRLRKIWEAEGPFGVSVGYELREGQAFTESLGRDSQLALVHSPRGWMLVSDAERSSSPMWEAAPVTTLLSYAPDAGEAIEVPAGAWNEVNLALHAAELVGVMREAISRTIRYLEQREQFGRPIGSFQALQHRTVDMVADLRACEGMVEYALWQWSGQSPDPWIRAAVGLTAESGVKALRECFQFHGGIAMTAEFWLHHWLRRATRLATFQGGPAAHFRQTGAQVIAGAMLEVPLAAV